MPSLAITPPGAACRLHLFDVDRNDLGADLDEPKIEL